jgi:Histidine phosphatase superfamily (branch 2)
MRFHRATVAMTAAMLSITIGTTTLADIRIGSPVPFYSVYDEYPEYCSTPPMMSQRKIPVLKQDSRLGETRLVHVTAVIRHGARTPVWGENQQCWEGYWDNPETGVWNCSLLTQMGPPTPKQAKTEEGMDVDDTLSDTIVLFEKHYDALMDPQNDLSNKLLGTCQMGQLLLQGYEQHVTNGQILRDAYCYDSNIDVNDHDIRMRLLEVNAQNNQPWAPPQVYLRSDDDQRVLVSGQVLVRSMFEQEIAEAAKKGQQIRVPVHLADYDQDIVGLSESVCPRLTEMREDFEKSSIFKRYNTSDEAHEIYKFIKNDLKANGPVDVIDCLMTTVCTDRPLHPAFDYGGKSEMFDRLATFVSSTTLRLSPYYLTMSLD